MKLGIIGGAGLLGSTTAFYAGTKNIIDEIKLVDLNKNLAKSHVMDMGQALAPISKTIVSYADYESLGDCDIILITASLPERNVNNRNEYLNGNLGVITPICQSLKKFCNEKIVINATNPVDVFNYVVWRLLGWDKRKMIGFSMNDSLRLKWATEMVTGKEYRMLVGYCIGEHGDGQIRLYEQMKYKGEALILNTAQRVEIEEKTARWFKNYQALESGRTSGWTSAVSLTTIIEAIVTNSKTFIPCSAILNGEMGYEQVSISLPLRLGINGIEEIVEPELTKTEKETLDSIVLKIQNLIKSISF